MNLAKTARALVVGATTGLATIATTVPAMAVQTAKIEKVVGYHFGGDHSQFRTANFGVPQVRILKVDALAHDRIGKSHHGNLAVFGRDVATGNMVQLTDWQDVKRAGTLLSYTANSNVVVDHIQLRCRHHHGGTEECFVHNVILTVAAP